MYRTPNALQQCIQSFKCLTMLCGMQLQNCRPTYRKSKNKLKFIFKILDGRASFEYWGIATSKPGNSPQITPSNVALAPQIHAPCSHVCSTLRRNASKPSTTAPWLDYQRLLYFQLPFLLLRNISFLPNHTMASAMAVKLSATSSPKKSINDCSCNCRQCTEIPTTGKARALRGARGITKRSRGLHQPKPTAIGLEGSRVGECCYANSP